MLEIEKKINTIIQLIVYNTRFLTNKQIYKTF